MCCVSSPSYSLSINGCLCGFFKGRRGLRQGDPISPLLFVIAMEYFSRLLKKMSRREEFSFRYKCSTMKLTHLIFADDLMLFSKGDLQSVVLMKRALKAFAAVSGLEASPEKTAIYFGSVSEDIQQSIQRFTGFQKGLFPFRYLGIPITSIRISKAECGILVDRIVKRIVCWSSRHLSYVVRVTLINSVLLSLHVYWSQIFLIPKGVMQQVMQICRAYLWDGKIHLNKPPPIAWSWLCKPKQQGGLGIRDCVIWNTAAIGKFVWAIARKEDSLWIKWVHHIYIKEGNWWEYKAPIAAS